MAVRAPSCRASLFAFSVLLAAFVADRLHDDGAGSASSDENVARTFDLEGVWTRYENRRLGEPVRFYYFHGDGRGLYRYGRLGRSYTHSFNYRLEGSMLHLEFRKTGDRYTTGVVVANDREGREWLTLAQDPRESGARYRKLPPPGTKACAIGQPGTDTGQGRHEVPVAGRIWIDHRNFKTGGSDFHMYQFNDAAIDGRGVGWFHRGDFDDWSTEALVYQLRGGSIDLRFTDTGEAHQTPVRVGRDAKGRPILTLLSDPRDFWGTHRYVDGGASFGLAPFAAALRWAGFLPNGHDGAEQGGCAGIVGPAEIEG
ncbi:MAG: hypothetical protein V3V08_20385 [Nannocystaceae bacterium]